MVIRLVKVHENEHLVEQCIALLNEEWPREAESRRKTINKSSNRFTPMCLALVEVDDDQREEKVIGFVKLTNERLSFDRRQSAGGTIFLESLVVANQCRGQGHGRFIMEEVERMLVKLKLEDGSTVDRINLTTTDKEPFYERMGYRRVTPAAVFAEEQRTKTSQQIANQQQQQPEKDAQLVSSLLPAPPMPPPPPMFTSSKITKSRTDPNAKVFMYKNIKQQ